MQSKRCNILKSGLIMFFIFSSKKRLLEFALVNYASRSDMHRENMKKQQRRQWEMAEQAALEAAAANSGGDHHVLADGATFPMVSHLIIFI